MKPLDQSYSKSRRFKNQVKAVVTNPYNVIVLVAIVLLTYLIVLPLVDMLSTTFQLAQRDLRATGGTMADVGKFTLYYWQRLLASDLSWNLLFKPLLNSLTIGVGVSVCAIALGSILAWLMVRSDLPFKPFFSLAVIIPYMIPSWVKSQAWLSMFKTPRVGGAPGFIAALMMNAGVSTEQIEAILSPIAYGRLAIIIVLTLHYYAYTYLLVSAALNSINSELEEMGEIQGASKPLILRKINQRLIGARKSYATIGGKGGRSTPIGLGGWKPIVTIILFIFFIVGIIMPVIILILESCMLKEGTYSLSNFTLYYWIGEGDPNIMEGVPGIFKNNTFMMSLVNSLKLTLVNGVFGTIFGQMLGYICAKGRGKLHGKLVEQLVFIPYLIPSVAFGGIYLSMFSKPQTLFGVTLIPALYGTFALLTLTSVVKHLPFASRAGTSNMLQISGELEEAATIEGAGFFKRFVKIVFPLSKGGFISGFMLIFVSIMKELDLIILIMTPKTSTLPYLAFQYQNQNCPQASNCVAIVMFSIVFLVYALANIFGDADLAKSMAG